MAPLSILPGRVRYESQLIVGKVMDCRYLNESINGINGVIDSFANHRTGRILVRFNEAFLDKESLVQRIKEIMKSMPHKMNGFELMAYHKKGHSTGMASHVLPQILIAAAAHVVLPKPLNLLLPMAIKAIRK